MSDAADDGSTDEPVVLVEDLGPVRRLTMNRPKALNALDHALIEGLSRGDRGGRHGRHGLGRHPAGRRPGLLRRLRPQRGRIGGRAHRRDLAQLALGLGGQDARDRRLPEAGHRERPFLLPGGGRRPDARVRPGGGRGRCRTSGTWTSASAPAWSRCSSRGSSACARRRSCCSPARTASRPTKRSGSAS